jgi:hypothetical protein
MRSFRSGLGMRIFFGFGVLVTLLLGIAMSGSYGLAVVGGELGKMDAIAGSLRRVQEITYRLEVIRRGLIHYRLDADAESLNDVIDAENRSVELLDEAAKITTSDQKRALYNSVAYKLRALAKNREQFMTLLHRTSEERKTLAVIGTAMMADANRLAEAAGASKSAADWVPGASVRIAFLTTDMSASRFLASADVDPGLVEAFKKQAMLAEGSLLAVLFVGSPDVKALIPRCRHR